MRIYKIKNINKFKYKYKKRHIACMGFFDGLHIGHKSIIDKAKELKKQFPEYELSLITINQKADSKSIFQSKNKIKIFKEQSFDNYFEIILNKKNTLVKKEDFILFLKNQINIAKIVIGPDYSFGYKAEGDAKDLKTAFNDNLFIIPFVQKDNIKVSTTLIKEMLKDKKIKEANELMHEKYNYISTIIHGNKNGRKINYPTINMLTKEKLLIPYGIFITNTVIKNKTYKSITCYYSKNNFILLETFILDFKQYVYGQEAKIIFLKFIRDNKPIKSIFDLIPLINNDLKITLKYFQKNKK